MPAKKISKKQYAIMVSGGMNDLMERKRKRNPQLYTKELYDQIAAIVRENNSKKIAAKKKNNSIKKTSTTGLAKK